MKKCAFGTAFKLQLYSGRGGLYTVKVFVKDADGTGANKAGAKVTVTA